MSIVFDEVQAEIASPPPGNPEAGQAPARPGSDDPAALERIQRALQRQRRLQARLAAD